MEFWPALGRLDDFSVPLQRACEALRDVARRERRLDRLEVVQQWLAGKERAREQQP